MTDADSLEVTDELGIVARLLCIDAAECLEVHVATPRLVLTRSEAAQVLAEIERATTDAPAVTVFTSDAVLRDSARSAGYRGGLRAPLVRDQRPAPAVIAPRTIAEWLPDAEIDVQPASPPRRVTRFLATGLDHTARITARRAGAEAAVVTPLGPDTLLEPVAATVDTLLDLDARFGAAQVRVPPITFSLNGTGIAHGRVAGANAGAGIVLSPMYVDAGALARIRRRLDATARGGGTARRSQGNRFRVELVVVHEVGHSVDQARGSGRLSDTIETRRALGHAVGIDSVELALRAGWQGSPPEWAAAHARIVDGLSQYATTNCVELFAEAFVAWYLGSDTPIVGAMDTVLRARYPELP